MLSWWIWLVSVAEANPEVLRFASGLRVVVEQRVGSPRVAIAATVAAGQDDAPPRAAEVAHLAEHLWYRASADGVPHGVRLHAWGCEWNAYTERTETTFHASCPADVTEGLLDLEAARLGGALDGVEDEEVAVERDVLAIEAEVRGHRGGAVLEAVVSRLDPTHPDRPGELEDEAAFEPDAVRAWAAARYVPEATVLAIVGPHSPASLRPQLEARFGPVSSTASAGQAARPAPVVARPTLRLDVRGAPTAVDAPVVLVSFDLPPETAPVDSLLAGLLRWELATQLASDGRVAGVDCITILASRRRALACGVEPAPHLSDAALDTFAADVRARTDVRGSLQGKRLRAAFTDASAQLATRFRAARDELGPHRSAWPAVLSGWMHALDQLPPADLAVTDLRGRRSRELQAQIAAALDPQRALVLLLTPDGGDRSLPAPRPRAGAVTVAWPSVPPVGDLGPTPTVTVSAAKDMVWVQRADLLGPQIQLVTGAETPGLEGRSVRLIHLSPKPPPEARAAGPVAPEPVAPEPEQPEAPEPEQPEAPEPERPPRVATVAWHCPVRPQDDAAAVVAAELLGARLWWTLRSDRGWSYTPEWAMLGDGLALGADVVGPAVADAVATLRDEVRAVGAGGIADAELAVAVRRGTVRTSVGLATPNDWPMLAIGPGGWRDAEAIAALSGRVAEVDAAAVAAVVARCDVASGWEITGSPGARAAVAPESGTLGGP